MPKLTTTRHDFLQDRQRRTFTDVLNDLKRPFDKVLDFFICGGRQHPMEGSETNHEPIPLAGHPHGTKRSRQVMDVATSLGMEHHGWKQTGKKSSLWAFEHRWAHRRDRAGGRNHLIPSKLPIGSVQQ